MKLNINSLIPIYGGCIQVIPCKVTQLNLNLWIVLIWDFTVLPQILKFIHADLLALLLAIWNDDEQFQFYIG